MPDIFNTLPGIEVPVGQISSALARMWVDTAAKGGPAPASDEVKATQVNFILHLGFGATPEDATQQFRTAVEFSSRYPSRVVVLCPMLSDRSGDALPVMRAKIYGECFLGKNKGDTRCCEFVILNYSLSARRFILDMAAAPADALTYAWPRPEIIRDLAYARMLPVRQSIGQFLSRYTPERLSGGLVRVHAGFEEVHAAEGRALLRWVREKLLACGAEETKVQWEESYLDSKDKLCFSLAFDYADGRHFRWQGNCHTGIAHFSANLLCTPTELPAHIKLLEPAQALSEAMFF